MKTIVKNKITDDVIKSFQEGNENSFNEIYDYYHNKIYFIAYEILNNAASSEDIVQDTFLTIYNKRQNLREPKAFNVWIKKIAYNLCLNSLRKDNKLSFEDDEEVMDSIQFSTNEENLYDDVTNTFIKEEIADSISNLSPKLKVVALLRFYEEFDVKETAEILQISESSVKMRTKRAREELQKELTKKEITPSIVRSQMIAPILINASLLLREGQIKMPLKNSNDIINGITGGTGVVTAVLSTGLLKGLLVGLTVTAAIVGGSVIYNDNNHPTSTKNAPYSIIDKTDFKLNVEPKITSIDYNKTWTNKDVGLNITTSGKYDQLLVNGEQTDKVTKNGVYLVTLQKDGKTVDSKEITVENIDKTNPELINITNDGRYYTVVMKDDLSGLNLSNIIYYKNGVISDDYSINGNGVRFQLAKDTTNKFYFFDKAGNSRYVFVNSKSE